MNREDIIRMARESGAGLSTSAMPLEHPWVFLPDELERFAALVVAAEREACAKVCEDMWHTWLDSPEENEPNKPDAEDCFKAIRARGTNDKHN